MWRNFDRQANCFDRCSVTLNSIVNCFFNECEFRTFFSNLSCFGTLDNPSFDSNNPSNLRVYLGLQDKSKVNADGSTQLPAVAAAVRKIIVVKLFLIKFI